MANIPANREEQHSELQESNFENEDYGSESRLNGGGANGSTKILKMTSNDGEVNDDEVYEDDDSLER